MSENEQAPINWQNQPSAYPVQPVVNPNLNNIYLTNAGSNKPVQNQKKPSIKTRIILLLILVIVMLVTSYVFLVKKGILDPQKLANLANPKSQNQIQTNPDLNNNQAKNPLQVSPVDGQLPAKITKALIDKKFANCKEVRKVLETENGVYVSCEGGVLVLSKDGTTVNSVVTQADGLPSAITTDLLINGKSLFIATQEGIAVYNLDTKEIKIINKSSGLASDHNITLAEEPGFVWVGTFEGISKIDKSTLKAETFNTITANITKPNIKKIQVFGDYVFAAYMPDTVSNGGLLVYDLKAKTFKDYPAAGFARRVNRIDFADMSVVESAITTPTIVNKLFLSTIDGVIYETRIGPVLNFTENKNLQIFDPSIKMSIAIKFLGKTGQKLITSSQHGITFFDLTTNKYLTKDMLSPEESANLLKVSNLYLAKTDLPKSYGAIVFGINDNVLIRADAALYKYTYKSNKLTKIIDLGSDADEFQIKKVVDAPEILIGHQECLGECAIIQTYKYNFETDKAEKLALLSDTVRSSAINFNTDLTDKMIFQIVGVGQSIISVDLKSLTATTEPYTADKYKQAEECKLDVKLSQTPIKITPKLSDGIIKNCDPETIESIKVTNVIPNVTSMGEYFYTDTDSKVAFVSTGLGLSVYRLE